MDTIHEECSVRFTLSFHLALSSTKVVKVVLDKIIIILWLTSFVKAILISLSFVDEQPNCVQLQGGNQNLADQFRLKNDLPIW